MGSIEDGSLPSGLFLLFKLRRQAIVTSMKLTLAAPRKRVVMNPYPGRNPSIPNECWDGPTNPARAVRHSSWDILLCVLQNGDKSSRCLTRYRGDRDGSTR